MIESLHLKNFKAFENFRVTFKGDAFLVGPNNAGKSTVIAALRSVANMVRMATREKPTQSLRVGGFDQVGYWFTSQQVDLIEENLQHEFHQVETRLKAVLASGTSLEAVWPIDEEGGFFFLIDRDGINLMRLDAIRNALPSIGVVPVLAPLEHSEELLTEPYVRENLNGRLASRHFRNQLYLLKNEAGKAGRSRFADFIEFAQPWLPEMELAQLKLQRKGADTSFDLDYNEPGSRIPKEVFWSGDGMQIWVQILLHLFRLQQRDVVVLDEPDVFLHSDLQRRLVTLLESLPVQTVTATHSAEVIAEASRDAVVWVSRNRAAAIRAPSRDLQFELSSALGTQFNLPLARALKTKVVVFVEGQDAKILRSLAKTLGNSRIVAENGIATVPLGGFDGWEHVEPFKWLVREFFDEAVDVWVILDRDFRTKEELDGIKRRLRDIGVHVHVWKRKELENYLIASACLARASGASEEWIRRALDDAASDLEAEVYAEIIGHENRFRGSRSPKTASMAGKARADELWSDVPGRLNICGGKSLLKQLNRRLQSDGKQAVTDRGLAARLKASEIPQEVKGLLSRVEGAAGAI